MPKHIGIVAVSPEGSSFCYRQIGRRASEIQNPDHRPTVSLHNLPFSTYVEALRRNDWPRIGDMLRSSASALAAAGANFCVLPDNVAHHALPLAQVGCPVPWLNMIDIAADAVKANNCRTVGLIGTKYVTFGSTYQTSLGLRGMRLLVPDAVEADDIDQIIFNEAIFGGVRHESRQRVVRAIERLGERGCDALILGCSEASLLMGIEDSPLPVFDPVELLAEAAIHRSVN